MTDKSNKIPVMSISLDHTIIHGESLHKLATHLKLYALRHGKLGLVKRLYSLCRRRSNQDISQRRFKFELIRAMRRLRDKDIATNFADKLTLTFRPQVLKTMEEFREKGGKIALVTSAPAEYASLVADRIGADVCISTPSLAEFRKIYPHDPIDYEECLGIEKITQLEAWLSNNNGYLHTVISGEPDELALLLEDVEMRYLVSPGRYLKSMLKRHNLFYEII